jgi:hypothetical protein
MQAQSEGGGAGSDPLIERLMRHNEELTRVLAGIVVKALDSHSELAELKLKVQELERRLARPEAPDARPVGAVGQSASSDRALALLMQQLLPQLARELDVSKADLGTLATLLPGAGRAADEVRDRGRRDASHTRRAPLES